jgi:hypothetical protein
MSVHTVRDWRGNKAQLSRCSDRELINMFNQSVVTRDQIRNFIGEVAAEMAERGLIPSEPVAAA